MSKRLSISIFQQKALATNNKSRLPWVNNQLKKLINKKEKLYRKKKRNPKYIEQYQKTKTKLQNEMRNSYWRYIENIIFDIEINEPDQPSFKNTPKKLDSYIKSQKNENTGIAPLRSEGTLLLHLKQTLTFQIKVLVLIPQWNQ